MPVSTRLEVGSSARARGMVGPHPDAVYLQSESLAAAKLRPIMVRSGPVVATMGPMVRVEFERVEALELLGMTLAHLKDAETRAEMSPRVPLLMVVREKLALALREER